MNIDDLIDDEAFRISLLYREIETDILVDIADMIRDGGISATGEYQLERLASINKLDLNALNTISKISGKPLNEILDVIQSIGIKSIDYGLYRTAFERSLLFNDIDKLDVNPFIKAMKDEATGYIKGVQTHAKQQAFKQFRNSIDKAILSVNTGLYTPQQAMVRSVKELAKSGINGATYLREGKPFNMGIEPVVYRAIRTEFIKTSNEVSHEVGIELGVEKWYVSQHLGARDTGIGFENHQSWQGKVYTTDELTTICGWREMLGLGGINCRHRHYAYIDGVSVLPPPVIAEEENAKVYSLTQKQRHYERAIREAKREILMLERFKDVEGFDIEIKKSKTVLRHRQKRIRELIANSDGILRRNSANERVVKP